MGTFSGIACSKDIQAPHVVDAHAEGFHPLIDGASAVRIVLYLDLYTSADMTRYLTGTTETNYDAWVKSQDFEPRKVQLSNTKAFWIGDAEAEDVVLYFHGGGWAMPGTDAHFILLAGLVSSATKAGKSVAALALQYDLAPSKHYPHQLIQCIELLRYAMIDLRKTPAQIMLGGDSSGGNLIFGVLSHVLHPHPSIAPVKLSEPLRGVILCSPVVCFNFDTARFRDSQIFEPAPASTLKVWVANYLWGGERDKWNEPLQAEVEWWNGLNDVVREMLITVAANEAMADDQLAMAAKIKVGRQSSR